MASGVRVGLADFLVAIEAEAANGQTIKLRVTPQYAKDLAGKLMGSAHDAEGRDRVRGDGFDVEAAILDAIEKARRSR